MLRWALTSLSPKVGRLVKVPDYKAIPNDLKVNSGVKAMWIEPVDESYIQGSLEKYAKIANVKPVRIPGYWYTKKGDSKIDPTQSSSSSEEIVILNIHGGGYVAQSAHPSDPTQNIPRGILKHFTKVKRILSPEYRLSKAPPEYPKIENAFPTALVDALTAYNYLVKTLGFTPSNIVVMGDSAGANLALALTRYLITNPIEALSPPAALILHSPWVDLGPSHNGRNTSLTQFRDSDYLGIPADEPTYAAKAFTANLPADARATDPSISPASKLLPSETVEGLFANFPDTAITSGGAEQLLDSIRTLKERMKNDMGGKLQYIEAKDAFHDFICFPWAEPERSSTLKDLATWFDAWCLRKGGGQISGLPGNKL